MYSLIMKGFKHIEQFSVTSERLTLLNSHIQLKHKIDQN